MKFLVVIHVIVDVLLISYTSDAIFVDKGNPYTWGTLKVGELTIAKTSTGSLIHTKAFFPLEPQTYPTVIFLGGFDTIVLAEYYETVLFRIASHGFFVYGLDYDFPVETPKMSGHNGNGDLRQNMTKYFAQIDWLQGYMQNKTLATQAWNLTALACHSSGCDATLKMIRMKPKMFQSTVFLEPSSYDVSEKVTINMPALMYGTELAEDSIVKCTIPGYDYNKFYDIWGCPRIVMEVADFGHCDILDPVPWEVCKVSHFCRVTKNVTKLDEYHNFVQGVASSLLITTLQGRPDAINYITEKSLIPLRLLEHKVDWNCTKAFE